MKTRVERQLNVHIGGRLRERRLLLAQSARQLSESLNTSVQQIYKYEKGIDGVSASKLYEFAQALQVSVAYFFEGLNQEPPAVANTRHRLLLEFMRNLGDNHDKKLLEALGDVVRLLSQAERRPAGLKEKNG